ncbi:MAG: hypothetical protein IKW83_06485 [Muribaculaceae bacterium]|nr:hypothetical protein [Muribaculaceae bacterium]
MKVKIIITFLFLFCCLYSIAQMPDSTRIVCSPNVAALQQYGDIPVSLFTGTPEIGISLYEFDVNGHKFPISVSYHTAGIRPEQRPGWLGVGWNLEAGGQISRVVNGLIDEGKLRFTTNSVLTDSAYMYHYTDLSNDNWFTTNYMLNIFQTKADDGILKNCYDLEPDEFRFNFLGYNGSFYLNHEGQWKVKCSTHFKVDSVTLDYVPLRLGQTAYANSHSKMISGFRMTADDGTRYYFGYSSDAVELTGQFYDQNRTHWNATSWQLTRIEYTNQEIISLEYLRGELTNQMWCNISNYTVVQNRPSFSCGHSIEADSSYCMGGCLTSPVFLQRIDFPSGYVKFYSADSEQLTYPSAKYYTTQMRGNIALNSFYYYLINGVKDGDNYIDINNGGFVFSRLKKSRILNSIKIYNTNDTLINNITFDFYNKGDNNHRVFLKNINNPQKWIGTYEFFYKNMLNMPEYLSGQIDHWGYYNARSVNYMYSTADEYFNSREPNPATSDYGIIQKIKYPTGGYSRFEFEPNTCSYVLSNDRTMVNTLDSIRFSGGNRIRRIYNSTTGNLEDEVLSREYLYVKDYASNHGNTLLSSGVLGGIPQYHYENFEFRSYMNLNIRGYFTITCSGNSLLSGGNNSQGSQIGYSEVVEKMYDGSFNVYKYSNFDNGYLDEQPCATFLGTRTEYAKYSSREQDRGLLLSKEWYDNEFRIVRKDSSSYYTRYFSDNYIRAIHWNVKKFCDVNCPVIEASSYKVFLDKPLLVSSVVTNYSDNSITSTTKHYTYNQYDQISQERLQTDINNDMFTNYTYLWQNDTSGNCSNYNLISPIKMIQKRQYSPNTSFVLSDKKEYKYEFFNNGRLCLPVQEIRYYNTNNPVDTCFATYNNYGRLTSLKDGNNEKVFLWGYSGQYLVAEIENSSINEILAKIPNLDQISMCPVFDSNTINNLRQQLPNAQITTYLYKPLIGMIAKINPSGITEFYKYSNVHNGWLNSIFDTEGNPIKVFNYRGLNY